MFWGKESEQQEKDITTWIVWIKFFNSAPSLSHIEINKYINYGPGFHGAFPRQNLRRIKDGAYVINLDDQQRKGTHWVSLFVNRNTAVYFDSFGIEHIPQEVLSKIRGKSIMCLFYCIAFLEYMIAGKKLLNNTNLFSPNNYEKNGKIIYKYFKDKYCKRNNLP